MPPAEPSSPALNARLAAGPPWLMLLGLTFAITLVLEVAHLPAAFLLGPMLAGIVLSGTGRTVRVPERPFLIAQGLVGCLMVRSLPLGIFAELAHSWPLFLGAVVAVIAAAAALGWMLTRWQVLVGC